MSGAASAEVGRRSWPRLPPVATAIAFAVIIGGVLVFVSGASPLEAYGEILVGALVPRNLPNTLNWAVPLVGMTLVAAIPLRGPRFGTLRANRPPGPLAPAPRALTAVRSHDG